MSEPMVMFGPDGETLVPFSVLRQNVNADLAQLAASKAKQTVKEMENDDAMCDKSALGGIFGEARDGDSTQ